MHRKAYVSGIAALLAALLAGCTGSSDNGGSTDDSKPGEAGTASAAARPGKYTTLPEACGAVGRPTLDSLLPGIGQLLDDKQRETAYDGEATLTFDTDRKVGCRWKVQSTDATDHLFVDLERVVSYDNLVSDDDEAAELFARKVTAADIPQPAASESGTGSPSSTASPSSPSSPASSSSGAAASSAPPSASGSGTAGASPSSTPTDLQPRLLDDLGDEAFVNDVLSSSGSTVKQRTVTVAFRTSNVIVTIEYEEQPATVGTVPDSKEMQDKARKLASRLADSLAG